MKHHKFVLSDTKKISAIYGAMHGISSKAFPCLLGNPSVSMTEEYLRGVNGVGYSWSTVPIDYNNWQDTESDEDGGRQIVEAQDKKKNGRDRMRKREKKI